MPIIEKRHSEDVAEQCLDQHSSRSSSCSQEWSMKYGVNLAPLLWGTVPLMWLMLTMTHRVAGQVCTNGDLRSPLSSGQVALLNTLFSFKVVLQAIWMEISECYECDLFDPGEFCGPESPTWWKPNTSWQQRISYKELPTLPSPMLLRSEELPENHQRHQRKSGIDKDDMVHWIINNGFKISDFWAFSGHFFSLYPIVPASLWIKNIYLCRDGSKVTEKGVPLL